MDRSPAPQDCGRLGCRPFPVTGPWETFLSRVGESHKSRLPVIKEKLGKYLGTDIEGKPVTLSGLAGLVSAAGMKGAAKWLDDAEDRVKYPGSTQMYQQTNGLF